MADITKNSFSEVLRHSRVVFQRARDILDFELNEFQDILRVMGFRAMQHGISGNENPGSNDQGYLVVGTGAANAVTIKQGYLFCDGVPIYNAADYMFSGFTTNAGPGDRTDTVYVAVTETEVADPAMIPQLGETTRRRKLDVTLGVAEGVAIPSSSALEIWEGGTHYFAIAEIVRPAATAAIAFGSVTDVRGLLTPSKLDYVRRRVPSALLNLEVGETSQVNPQRMHCVSAGQDANYTYGRVWLMAGRDGVVQMSDSDGRYWSVVTAGGAYTGLFQGIAFNDAGLAAMVGRDSTLGGATPVIHTWASNAVSTTARVVGAGYSVGGLFGVVWGDGLFVAVGSNGEIQTSPDGIAWTHRVFAGAAIDHLSGVAFGGGLYVAVGYRGAAMCIQTSPDGIAWSDVAGPSVSANCFLVSVAYGNGVYAAVGYDDVDDVVFLITSEDGASWERRANPFESGVLGLIPSSITFVTNAGVFALVTDRSSGYAPSQLAVSRASLDVTWDRAMIPGYALSGYGIIESPDCVASDGERIIIVGNLNTATRSSAVLTDVP